VAWFKHNNNNNNNNHHHHLNPNFGLKTCYLKAQGSRLKLQNNWGEIREIAESEMCNK